MWNAQLVEVVEASFWLPEEKDSALEIDFCFVIYPSNNRNCPFFIVDPTLSTVRDVENLFLTL